jgi:TRAP-type mannitol/chloroaromatic compound transport system permease small subunit
MNSSCLLTFANRTDQALKRFSLTIAWVYVILIVAIISQIILRRGFHNGFIALEELQWHLYAVWVMFGMVYTQVLDCHVRVDLVHQNLSRRKQLYIEIFGLLLLAMPLIGSLMINSFDFVYESWRVGETSDSTQGLDYRWIIKGVIPASAGLLLLAMLSRIMRSIAELISPPPSPLNTEVT